MRRRYGFLKMALILSAIVSVVLVGLETLKAVASGNGKSDETLGARLYREMGILKLPGIAPPMDIALKDLAGKTVRLSDFIGKIVFLNFWTTWCPPCRFEMPAMEKLHSRLKNKDFAMLAVDLQESASRVEEFVREHKLTFTILLDSYGDVGRRFGIRSIPTTYILGRTGAIIGKALGPREWDGQKSVEFFNHLMK